MPLTAVDVTKARPAPKTRDTVLVVNQIMLMTQLSTICSLATGLAISLGVFASDASGQMTTPSMWETEFNPSASAAQFPRAIYALQDGGCLSLHDWDEAPIPGRELVNRRKIDENGEVLWSYDTTISQTFNLYTAAFPDGSGAILTYESPELRVVRFGSDGLELWDRSYSSTDPNGRLVPRWLGTAPNGDLVVTSYDVLQVSQTVVFRLDAQGNEQWRYETPANIYWAESTSDGSTIFATRDSQFTPRVAVCVDPMGNEAWRTPMPQAGGPIMIDVNSIGELALIYRKVQAPQGQYTIKLDSSGQVVFNLENPAAVTGNLVRGVAISEQGVVSTLTGSPYQIHSYDPTGTLLWVWSYNTPPNPQIVGIDFKTGYDPSGNLIVVENFPDAAMTDRIRGIDSNGQTAWVAPVGDSDGPGLNRSLWGLAVDDRGHLFYQSAGAASFGALPDAPDKTGKVVLSPEVGIPFCNPAQTNSTGSPAELHVLGEANAGADNLALYLVSLPANTFALALNSRSRGFTPLLAGGQGNLCLDGAIGRYSSQILQANTAGTTSLQLHPTETPTPMGPAAILIGEIWHFQAWYRDSNPTATSNLTNAVAVTF